MKTINILWTGGWDSTYRIVELSRMDVQIHPVYCRDPNRKSTPIELETMEKIVKALQARPETTAQFLPITIIDRDAIPENPEITNAFKEISSNIRIGGQYDWLARIALIHPELEIGIEKPHGEYSGCVAVLDAYGKLIQRDGSFFLDKENATPACVALMGNFSFPIYNITEVEMLENIRSWGYEDIMKMIWFCHGPVKGLPCGTCRPCQQKMDCGMGFLLPDSAKRRYRAFRRTKRIFGDKIAKGMARYVYKKIL